MRLYDVESSAQKHIMYGPSDDLPLFDNTSVGKTFEQKDFKALFS